MRGHFAGIRAAVFSTAVLMSLLFVGSALAVTVTNFSPTSGLPAKDNGEACPGGTIQITGTGFATDGGTVSVAFGGVNTPVVQVGSDNTIYAVVPDGAKTGPITVTTGKGSATTSGTFYVNPCPQISLKNAQSNPSAVQGVLSTPTIYKFKPAKGPVGTKVTLTGSSMLGVTGVYFGATKAKYTIDGPTQITATVPKGAKTGKIALLYKIGASTTQGGITPDNSAGNSSSKQSTQLSFTNFKVQ